MTATAVPVTRWQGCYTSGWDSLLEPSAYAHPAKVARGLAERLYRHLLAQGYLKPGDTVLDPFGGISGFAWDATNAGMQWIGVELEENFRILSHKNMLLWSERWCTCGNDGAAYVSALRQSISSRDRASQSSEETEVERPVLLQGMWQPSLFHGQEDQREHPQEIPRAYPVEQGQAVVSVTPPGPQRESARGQSCDGQEWPLARGPLHQAGRLCRDTSQREGEARTSACDGADTRQAPQAQRTGAPHQPGQDGQSPREPGTDECQRAYAPSQPAWATEASTSGPVLRLRDDGRDTGNAGAVTNRLFLDNLQARQAAGIRPSVTRPQTCENCGKLKVLLPVLLQGDSRRLREVLAGAQVGCVVGSPPYAGVGMQEASPTIATPPRPGDVRQYPRKAPIREYGSSPGQLGAMPPGAVVSSPPYAESLQSGSEASKWALMQACARDGNGHAMKHMDPSVGKEYGTTPGQLGAMPPGAVVGSPPYEGSAVSALSALYASGGQGNAYRRTGQSPRARQAMVEEQYGCSPGQLGNTAGDTFWSASAQIMAELAALLPPGAVCAWVLKAYVSKGRIVPFPDQWRALCESHGFETREIIHASLIEDSGVQETFFNGPQKIQSKKCSFFRRLAEKRGSPPIDHETIIIVRKESS